MDITVKKWDYEPSDYYMGRKSKKMIWLTIFIGVNIYAYFAINRLLTVLTYNSAEEQQQVIYLIKTLIQDHGQVPLMVGMEALLLLRNMVNI